MSKIAIQPLTYRAGIGVALEVTSVYGNPPLTACWQIITDIGHPLESGEIEYSIQQWQDWPTGPDENYIEKIVASMLAVSLDK
jgi:hypothetical protein